MSENEKLIDAAEAMTADEIHQHPMAALDKLRALARELRAAEKAHTPTDDEREALIKRLADELEYRVRTAVALSKGGHDHRPQAAKGRASIEHIAAGFRRSEVPEPSRQIRECTVCGEKVTLSNATEEWEKRHGHAEPQGEPSDAQVDRLIEAALVALIHDPEVPTGMRPHLLGGEVLVIRERTDAEPIVRAVIHAVSPALRAHPAPRTGQEVVDAATRAWSAAYHRYASPHDAMRAALRAASAVTDQGEGKSA